MRLPPLFWGPNIEQDPESQEQITAKVANASFLVDKSLKQNYLNSRNLTQQDMPHGH